MSIATKNDVVTYQSGHGDLTKVAEMVVAVGAAADDAAAAGNPVQIGGKYEATLNTVEDGDASALKTDTNGRLLVAGSPAYPYGSTPLIAGSGNVANASAAATLTPTATTTAHLSGFEVTGSGATSGLPVTVTVAGLLGGTRHYTYCFAAGALVANTPLVVPFDPPLPASAVNTAIVVTCPAGGTGNTNNTVVAHGFYI